MSNLGASEAERREQPPTVAVKDQRDENSIINRTGSLLVGAGETIILTFLLLASGDLFLLKLVHVMPTLSDKKRAVEICREIQQSLAHYLLTVSLINAGLAVCVGGGLYLMGVPNAGMWGVLVAVLNFIPYFGPIGGVIVLSAVGLLDFDTLWQALLPPAWYFSLHLLESNVITPILLGHRFELNAVVIFVSLIFWTWIWGVPGALLSVPFLVAAKVICSRFKDLSPISELLAH
jgi:predicted PurR-regulated permease PerM